MALPANLLVELSRRDRKKLAVRAAMLEAAASLFADALATDPRAGA